MDASWLSSSRHSLPDGDGRFPSRLSTLSIGSHSASLSSLLSLLTRERAIKAKGKRVRQEVQGHGSASAAADADIPWLLQQGRLRHSLLTSGRRCQQDATAGDVEQQSCVPALLFPSLSLSLSCSSRGTTLPPEGVTCVHASNPCSSSQVIETSERQDGPVARVPFHRSPSHPLLLLSR